MKSTENKGMLAPYRVLDLTDVKGFLCGKILGDMAADVIKIEKPGGDESRKLGPFFHNEKDPEKSLVWWAFNTSKRGITLDITSEPGKNIFANLIRDTDIIIESFQPGYMDSIGLGHTQLAGLNPGLITVSISPFGQRGPYRDYLTSDIVAWAMGGYMYPFGEPDRPPIRISQHSQAYLHAGGAAAGAALLALYNRELTGRGQYVDVSIHETVGRIDMTHKWDATGVFLRRGEWLARDNYPLRYIWPCKDGYVMWNYWAGPAAALWTRPFTNWMAEAGNPGEEFKQIEWETIDITTEEGLKKLDYILKLAEKETLKFFQTRTKAELDDAARKLGIMLYPVADAKDVLESHQLAYRKFWCELGHPGLDLILKYPGPIAIVSEEEARPIVRRRAPLIGEHNREIYIEELKISELEFEQLQKAGVI